MRLAVQQAAFDLGAEANAFAAGAARGRGRGDLYRLVRDNGGGWRRWRSSITPA
jgi:hypothetical protein